MSLPYTSKAANGYYYVLWSDDGRSKRKSLGTQDARIAEERFAEWLTLRRAVATDTRATAFTVADIWRVYEERHARHKPSHRTICSNWRSLEQHFGHLPIDRVTQETVDAYVARCATGEIGKGAKPHSSRSRLTTLSAILRFGASRKGGSLYAAAEVPAFDLPPVGPPRDRCLTLEEIQALFAAAAQQRCDSRMSYLEKFLWLALETGARRQAILDLTWDQVDLVAGVIHYHRPGDRVTSKRRPSVPISSSLRPVLERALAERKAGERLVVAGGDDVWCALQRAVLVTEGNDSRVPRHRLRATGIHPHTLRHTAATMMARRGVPLWDIANILGNSLLVVERVYAKWAPNNPAATVDRISAGRLPAPK